MHTALHAPPPKRAALSFVPRMPRLAVPGQGVYLGTVLDERPSGHGKMWSLDGRLYEGEWLDGVKSGCGTEIYPDRSIYSGKYHNGVRHGHGVLKYANGDVYDGREKMPIINASLTLPYKAISSN